MAYLAAQVRHLVPDLRWLCSLCGGPLYCHLLHPEVLHVFPTILRKHPNLRTSCYGQCCLSLLGAVASLEVLSLLMLLVSIDLVHPLA